jgi:hypothetical protein
VLPAHCNQKYSIYLGNRGFCLQHRRAASSNDFPDISDAICLRNSAGLTGLLSTS